MTEDATVSFSNLRDRIMEKWPDLNEAALDATQGDFDKLVDLISEAVEKPRNQIRRQLRELSDTASEASKDAITRVEKVLRDLEDRAEELRDKVKNDLVPQAEDKMRENLLTSLLIALGLGLILGLVIGGSVKRD